MIQSYEKHFPAYEKMKEIMSSDLRKKGIHASVYSFYLDCEQYSEKQQRQKLFKKLNELSTWNPDIILVNDDQAFEIFQCEIFTKNRFIELKREPMAIADFLVNDETDI